MADLLVATLQDAVRDAALHRWQLISGSSNTSAGGNSSGSTSGSAGPGALGTSLPPIPAPMLPGNYESRDPVCKLGVRKQYSAVQYSAAQHSLMHGSTVVCNLMQGWPGAGQGRPHRSMPAAGRCVSIECGAAQCLWLLAAGICSASCELGSAALDLTQIPSPARLPA